MYKNYGKERCTSHSISYNALYKLVLDDIHRQAASVAESKDDYIHILQYKMDERTAQEIKTDKCKLKKAEKRIVQLEKVLNKLYEDRALDKINEERYLAMNSQYETEYNELKAQAQALHESITATETATMNAQIFSDLIEKYADLQELNARILNELIERIVIHEKEIINGEKFQRVDIYYKFVGLI